jgi:hypothetical protein
VLACAKPVLSLLVASGRKASCRGRTLARPPAKNSAAFLVNGEENETSY